MARAHRGGNVANVRRLTAKPHTTGAEPPEGQAPLFTDAELVDATIPDPSAAEQVTANLHVLSAEVEGHIMDSYWPLLDHLVVTHAEELLGLRSGSEVVVAGVRVATQTPPMRSGQRTVFISLDDSTGIIDVVFFDEAQGKARSGLFTANMMSIHGHTRRTGDLSISVQADEAHDLRSIWNDWVRTAAARTRPKAFQ
ncbi:MULTISPECIES: OB-fold nucleic acid binding domain-containing protein [Auritidibacter]|uniref:OB-fold nucleic acid binding domain-containing protein n=1 Tax=Auritidibacter TaxID=1160973 RepID=UPI000D7395E4|nr:MULTISPECIES: OB-fold nucleic acid binding domain-containing protein [Auritidibacter]AXR73390.1 hypothetical protein DCC27_002660 [Auritidibacter sp. NML130574]WGH84228.1 OB-fold nucleic acid binding domain-containing protein [Auritidibacter ignavus]